MVAWNGTQLSLRSLIESARTVLDLVSAPISVLSSGLWMPRRQLCPSLCHRCIVGPQDGVMEESRVRRPLQPQGTTGNCAPAGNSANFCSSSSWLVGFPKPLAQQQLQPQDFGIPLGYTFPRFAGLTVRTHRKSLSGFPLSAVLAVGHFLVTVCRSLGYSLLPPSPPPLRSPLPSGSSLTCFLAFWVLLVGSGWQVCRRMLQGLRGHWSCSLSVRRRKQIQRGEAGPLGTHSE